MWVVPRRPWALTWVLSAVTLGLLVVGLHTTHEVKQKREGRRSRQIRLETITELQLIEDATFSGVVREDGILASTYDRTRPRGRLPCPT